jgi:phosphoribosylformimino-5-aminoimidazole carboxamide ribonucleotide (ProFAR) isomerase
MILWQDPEYAADALTMTERWNAAGVALHLVDMDGAAIDTAGSTGRRC